MFAAVFAGTVSCCDLMAVSWMMSMSRQALVGMMDRGTVDGGLSNALWPGRSTYSVDPSGRWDLRMSTV